MEPVTLTTVPGESTRRDSTIMLRVEMMNGSARSRSSACSRCGNVGRAQVDQGVGLAGDGVGADHLGMPAGRGGDLGRRGAAGAEQLDERLGRPADRGRVDDRGEVP